MIACEWFAMCTNEAVMLVPHPAFPKGVPTCVRCAAKAGEKGTPIPYYEDWFKLLWNAALAASDELDWQGPVHESPLFGLLETMHGIAEDQPQFTKNGHLAEVLG